MNKVTGSYFLAIALLLAGCAGLGHKPETPRINLVGLKILDIQLFEQRFGLTLRIQNPNRAELTIEGISFEVEINDHEFAHGVDNQGVTVPAYGESVMEVEVVSTLFSLIDQLRDLNRRSGKPLDYLIRGRISLAGSPISIPFEETGRLGGKTDQKPPSEAGREI
jgi:LEA14-like dessication related protein